MTLLRYISTGKLAVALLLVVALPEIAVAAPIMCQDTAMNHMLVADTEVSACLDAGSGNISGNPLTDPFLMGSAGTGYTLASKSDSANPFNLTFNQTFKDSYTTLGAWSIDPSYWLSNDAGVLGFKFGTGNNDDEWFIFQLIAGVSSGDYEFINVFHRGGGLSHTNLYAVPEPGTLLLLGLGLIGLLSGRRKSLI